MFGNSVERRRSSKACEPWEVAIQYHERTKHHFDRYSRSLGYMDWANQPDPFRRYPGAPLVELPLPQTDQTPPYESLYRPGSVPTAVVSRESISEFFFYSLALSAWKTAGLSTWSLRVNPSSGNLHPTECYLISGPIAGICTAPAVHHYAPQVHGLERRAELDADCWGRLAQELSAGAMLLALTSIPWRESWKYGERAYRYCQHDAGHALAALRLSATVQGWRLYLLAGAGDDQIGRLVGLDRHQEFISAEPEHPDLLALLVPSGAPYDPRKSTIPDEVLASWEAGQWRGRANQLSRQHQPWEVIERVERACRKPAGCLEDPEVRCAAEGQVDAGHGFVASPSGATAGRIIRQRRSAVDMDGRTSLSRERFYDCLGRVVPALSPVPWDAWPGPPMVHLGLFVQRVDGLSPGLYALARDGAQVDRLRQAMRPEFVWQRPPGCPADLPLYLLLEGDVGRIAMQVSCHQHIAGQGAFSLGMLAEFEPALRQRGAWFYRRLFWETGMIGQVLYLEAEAAGVRATGIGCFFDDPVHALFGIADRQYQSLYHFTVGGPVEDIRITSRPAYENLAEGML